MRLGRYSLWVGVVAVIVWPVAALAAADALLGVEMATGVPEVLTPSEASALLGSGGLPDTPVATSEGEPVMIYGQGAQSANGWHIGQGSDGNPFLNCYIAGTLGNCDYYRKLNAGKKAGYKDSSGNIDFEYTESSGEVTAMTVNAETSGVHLTLYQKLCGGELAALSPSDGAASHIWDKDPLSTAPTLTARAGTNRGVGVLTFPDSDGDYGVQIQCELPPGFTGQIDAVIWWDTTGTGNAVFQVQSKCYADDEADDASFNTVTKSTAQAAGTSGRPNRSVISNITITGCAADELASWRFFRNRTEATVGDTLNAALVVRRVTFWARNTY